MSYRTLFLDNYFCENFSAKFPMIGSLKYCRPKALIRHMIKAIRIAMKKTKDQQSIPKH